jgi:hypothetical protein
MAENKIEESPYILMHFAVSFIKCVVFEVIVEMPLREYVFICIFFYKKYIGD